ncbi:NAD(P)-dependent oxidoreductase [Amphritea pacifica]|uniref:NAD(P)-dependent oxidoreductase n=1 Tax=Amphritea pacifica TaxID=2811233 RepID=A0ABS2W8L7_9GAMM|nr:NAD(P)-dependent oxidoreductase [Amphritea pacifica]MBN0987936.1 NAD(P)-dependent oxidoreductase [Amphritea pacifica]MBN1005480.1 NAD(P)-dependent oxidoreductase [Amphritea pacifica]
MKIAFLGTGLMGRPMAINLLNSGYKLTLWNRTRSKAEALISYGAEVADTAAQAIADADITITMLENGPIVDQVLFNTGHPASFKRGSTVIDMSSIPPELAKQHFARLKHIGVNYLDAPVSGGTVGAQQASLAIMVGGEKTVFDHCHTLFTALGKVTYIGPAGSGQLAKCANQAIVGITIGAVAEALLLAAQGGADPAAVREALLGGFASSRILELHGQRMIDREFNPGATSRVQLKDLRTILDTAQAEALSLPLVQQTFEQYQDLVNNGLEEVDHSGLLLQLERLNGNRTLNNKPTTSPYDSTDHT